jgi:hypothetical protein
MDERLMRRRHALAAYLGIPEHQIRNLSTSELEQLENCKSESAMRLLLGISEKDYDLPPRTKEG